MHRYTVQDTFPPNGQKHNRRGAGEDLLEGAQVIIIRVSTYMHTNKPAHLLACIFRVCSMSDTQTNTQL